MSSPRNNVLGKSRAEKSRKARKKAEIISKNSTVNFFGVDRAAGAKYVLSKIDEINSVLIRLNPALTQSEKDKIVYTTGLIINQLVIARSATAMIRSETAVNAELALRNVLDGVNGLCKSMRELSMQNIAGQKFDEVMLGFLAKFGADLSWARPMGIPAHFSMTIFLSQIAQLIEPIVDDLSEASLIRKPHEYACAAALSLMWFEFTHKSPTLTQNAESTKTIFQEFVEAVIPRPPIGDDILRSARDEVKQNARNGVRMWIEDGWLQTAAQSKTQTRQTGAAFDQETRLGGEAEQN